MIWLEEDIKQKDIAKILNVSQQLYSFWEKGTKIHKELKIQNVDEKSTLWNVPERDTFGGSILAGSSRRPPQSDPNPVRPTPLSSEWETL